MSRGKTKLLMVLLSLVILTGCWDQKEINMQDYVNTIGIDYENGQYIVYLQLVNFKGIAKTEGGGSDKPTPVWIGKGKGNSIGEAIDQIRTASSKNLFWGHITAVVFSEKLLNSPIFPQFLDEFNREATTRYTMWTYGTNEKIDSIFKITPPLTQSQLLTLLHHPEDNYQQLSIIRPLTFRDFLADYYDHGHCVLLPALKITQQAWSQDTKASLALAPNGVYAFQNKESEGFLPIAKIKGIQWVQDKTSKVYVFLKNNEKTLAVLVVRKPDVKIRSRVTNHQFKFDVNVKVKATVLNNIQKLSEHDLRDKTEQEIQKEIKQSFHHGLATGADILQLGNSLYRKNPKAWHEQSKGNEGLMLTPSSLGSVHVNVNITSTDKYKVKFK